MEFIKTAEEKKRIRRGYIYILTAALCFSAKAIIIKLAYADYPGLDATTLLAWRMIWSLPFFGITAFIASRDRIALPLARKDIAAVIGLGVLGYYVSSWLDFAGLQYVSAGTERMVLFTYPTLVVLLTALVEKRAVTRSEMSALAFTYGGLALVFLPQSGAEETDLVKGALLVFSAAVTFAVFTVATVPVLTRIGAFRFTAYTMTAACCATSIHYLILQGMTPAEPPAGVIAYGATLALVSTIVPAFLVAMGLRALGANRTAIVNSFSPVATLILAYFFLEERLTILQAGGALLVIGGIFIIGRSKAK